MGKQFAIHYNFKFDGPVNNQPTISWIKVDSTEPDQVRSQTGLEISNRENWILPGCGEESKRNHILPAIYRHAAKKN